MVYTRSSFPLLDVEGNPFSRKINGADPTLPHSYLPTFDFSQVMTVDRDFIPEATHLFQLEWPAECAAAIREFMAHRQLVWREQGRPFTKARLYPAAPLL